MRHALARRSLVAVALAAVLGGTSALAEPDAASRPATTQAGDDADATLDRLLGQAGSRPRSDAAPRREATPNDPTAVAPDASPGRLLREGTFLVDRVGHVRETDAGDLEFVFAADNAAAAAADPPMQLVPNLNLMAIDSQPRGREGRRYRVTGRVTEYRGRNYLILEKVVFLDN